MITFNLHKFASSLDKKDVWDHLDFWISAATLYDPHAFFFLVGTCKDLVPDPEVHSRISTAIL
jgi:hypothetical protein